MLCEQALAVLTGRSHSRSVLLMIICSIDHSVYVEAPELVVYTELHCVGRRNSVQNLSGVKVAVTEGGL